MIEVSLPLEKINAESAREKSIRHGHPSTLHLWWSRKPLATARAVLFAQLVDDPSSRPDLYPTEEDQALERKKLHQLIERLVVWENSNDQELLREAHQKILESTDGNPPPILDPFAGGGSIPLEAQRLGLEAHASDLNPVAVLINKALIEIPPKFAGRPPVFPGAADLGTWPRATGLAEDVRRYGEWMRDEAKKRIGHLYPDATLPDGSKATVIAWIWARTVTCPNPACSIQMPLTSKWWLGKKKGKEAWVQPIVEGKTVRYEVRHGTGGPKGDDDGTVGRTGARCIACDTSVELKYIRAEGRAGRLSAALIATVAEGKRTRIYLDPTPEMESAASVPVPASVPPGNLPKNPRDFKTPNYGMTTFADLFTPRQLTALTTFSDLVGEAREQVLADALVAGIPHGDRLDAGGGGAEAYADAVATYLGFALSRMTNKSCTICSWDSSTKMEAVRSVFARQALPMTWDFAESNPWGGSGGDFSDDVMWVFRALARTPCGPGGEAIQQSAGKSGPGALLSTDPPYYDNIGYSDLSDFFYVWLRRSLREVHPSILSTMLVPKADELVANPYRHDGKEKAHKFFEDGFREVFARARGTALPDFPIAVYYAFKQQDTSSGGEASNGWETLLEGMIGSGWAITATWPMRSELGNRMLSQGTNALASSIVLALRPRPEDAPSTDRRGFLNALKVELPKKLRDLQQGSIAPVDLPQAAIGPGMAVYSRYSGVYEDDGTKMTVRTALQQINAILDEVLSAQENDFDPETRFALAWFKSNGFAVGKFGDAESLSNARGVSLDHLERSGILTKGGGKVALIGPTDLPEDYAPESDALISQWEVVLHLARVLESDGIPAAAALLGRVPGSVDRDLCKELAALLFRLSDSGPGKNTQLAIAFNALGAAWNDIAAAAKSAGQQLSITD
ncbi:DUF1156 domain-containing protein [Tsukamurella soli]|uniref:DUF1156 domain-containing protein n=1 Tax=Tsukamurella soli TaxID=644556 RepID=A0ABP8K3L1_9ACTN